MEKLDKVKPKTAVGRFLDRLPESFERSIELNNQSMFFSENKGESLIFELPSKKKIKFVPKVIDSKKCRIWKGNIRLQEFLDDNNTLELREKIQSQGQLIPVMARPIKNDPNFTHEIIYGSRRLYVCSSLGINIKILEAELDDNDALVFMDAENAGREDLSPYEAAKAYKHWLDSGIFKNQNELAEKLGITRSWVNKVLSLTKIPSEIVSAIGGPKNLSIKEGLELIKIIAIDPQKTKSIISNLISNKDICKTVEQVLQAFSDKKPLNNEIKTNYSKSNESCSRVLYSKEGQNICKITNSRQGKLILTFNSKFSKIEGIISEIENIIKNNF
ncbi:MAG: ParB/RepB/Spo0J family partition protein [Gammaproteobacteria bacterium]